MAKMMNQPGRGVSDWIVQRLSAYILLAYFTVLAAWWLFGDDGFLAWYGFIMSTPMKIFSVLAVLSLAGHAWVGMWTVGTDYIKPVCIRQGYQIAIALALAIYVIWTLTIFWG